MKFDDKVNLIGSQSSNKWALLANYSDSSGIRNALSYYLGEEMKFEYTSEINYISLYVNGSYMGLYTAAIKGYKTDDNATNIFEQSRSNKDYDWVSDNDGYYIQYFIIDDNGKIKAINPWDYDLTFGISWDAHYDIQTNRIYMPNIWYSTLYQFDEFKDEVSSFLDDYKELLTVKLSNKVDELETMLNIDWYNDKIRWQNEKPFGSGSAGAENTKLKSMNYDFSSFIDNCQYIKDHIIKRFAFLSDYWKSPEKYYNITFRDEAISDTDVYIKKGTEITQEVLPDGILNIDEEGFIGWYTKDGISLYDVKNVTEDIIFYSKYDELHISNDKEETDSNANSLEIKNSTSSSESSYKVSTFTKYIPSSIKTFLKKVYHHSGLDILGKNGLIICGIFGILLIAVIIAEIVTMIRQRRDSR